MRYLSAERNEWEEVPNSLVDWAATDKYEKDRAAGKPAPEAVALDKELEAERQADEARSPHVAPGLRLPDDGGVILLDTFQTQPQLVELQQSSGELNKNMKGNILRATINPIASAKQTIELPGLHAKIQAHVTVPAIYVNLEQQDQLDKATQIAEKSKEEQLAWDRFRSFACKATRTSASSGTSRSRSTAKSARNRSWFRPPRPGLLAAGSRSLRRPISSRASMR